MKNNECEPITLWRADRTAGIPDILGQPSWTVIADKLTVISLGPCRSKAPSSES